MAATSCQNEIRIKLERGKESESYFQPKSGCRIFLRVGIDDVVVEGIGEGLGVGESVGLRVEVGVRVDVRVSVRLRVAADVCVCGSC